MNPQKHPPTPATHFINKCEFISMGMGKSLTSSNKTPYLPTNRRPQAFNPARAVFFAPHPRKSGANPRGFNTNPCGYNANPHGCGTNPYGYNLNPSGFNTKPYGFDANPYGFAAKPRGFATETGNIRVKKISNTNH
jgi:hypothetical protein